MASGGGTGSGTGTGGTGTGTVGTATLVRTLTDLLIPHRWHHRSSLYIRLDWLPNTVFGYQIIVFLYNTIILR